MTGERHNIKDTTKEVRTGLTDVFLPVWLPENSVRISRIVGTGLFPKPYSSLLPRQSLGPNDKCDVQHSTLIRIHRRSPSPASPLPHFRPNPGRTHQNQIVI